MLWDAEYQSPCPASVQISVDLRCGLNDLAVLDGFDRTCFWTDQICVNQYPL
jgi:hypothetical protein